MFSAAFGLLMSCPLLMLRLSSSGGTFPRPLSVSEEREYVAKLADGDTEARNILIEHNLRLVAHIIKKYYSQSCDQDDLISIGTIGLIKGVSTYRPDKGVRLATYASRCIENEILMHFRSIRKNGSDVSLSDAIDRDGDGDELSLIDVLASDDDMLEKIDTSDTNEQLRRLINSVLDEREREIILLRYGFCGAPLAQREVAEKFGISRSYVSRIEKKAIKKLHDHME